MSLTLGSSTFAAKKKHNKESSDNSDSAAPNPGTQVGGIWDETIAICHWDAESGDVRVMEVSTPTVPQYLNAGDTLFMDCCVDADCPKRLCLSATGCIEGPVPTTRPPVRPAAWETARPVFVTRMPSALLRASAMLQVMG